MDDDDNDSVSDDGSDKELGTELRNPSDALHILAKSDDALGEVMGNGTVQMAPTAKPADATTARQSSNTRAYEAAPVEVLDGYEPITAGLLTLGALVELLRLFSELYHAYLPIAPAYMVRPLSIEKIEEPDFFLLTVMLTIASRDQPEYSLTHRYCWEHTKRLLLDVLLATPWTQTTRTAEGLLLLSEWLPQIQQTHATLQQSSSPLNEDRTAWSFIGQAVRHAYMLGLDRGAFPEGNPRKEKKEMEYRRLIWAYVYIADRQISVRLGQSFWCRGPALSTRFTAKDFPMLQPKGAENEDYASALQATLELTQIIHNGHDILYSSRARTLALLFAGDYNRYLDDFQRAATAWKLAWGNISVAPQTKRTLLLLYEYLCLYVNAFSFQAVLTREASRRSAQIRHGITKERPSTMFPGGIMSSPDGRYIFDAVIAALKILQIMVEMSPENEMRYLPTKYYLYAVYAAVFLHKASLAGATEAESKQQEASDLVLKFTDALQASSASESHVGSRYSVMLKKLWMRTKSTKAGRTSSPGEGVTEERESRQNRPNHTAEHGSKGPASNGTSVDKSFCEIQTTQLLDHNSLFSTEDMLMQELSGGRNDIQSAPFFASFMPEYFPFQNTDALIDSSAADNSGTTGVAGDWFEAWAAFR